MPHSCPICDYELSVPIPGVCPECGSAIQLRVVCPTKYAPSKLNVLAVMCCALIVALNSAVEQARWESALRKARARADAAASLHSQHVSAVLSWWMSGPSALLGSATRPPSAPFVAPVPSVPSWTDVLVERLRARPVEGLLPAAGLAAFLLVAYHFSWRQPRASPLSTDRIISWAVPTFVLIVLVVAFLNRF